MKINDGIQFLGDDELLSAAKTIAAQERNLTAKLLRHLREIETRLLFAKLGYSSLFQYVTEELGYCGASAQARIVSMRLMAAIPTIEEKIVTGSVSLTNLAQAQRFFNQERKDHQNHFTVAEKKLVIEKLEGKSTRDAEKELMALSSQPEKFCRPDQIRPVTPTLSEVRFTAGQSLLDQLDQIRGLLAHQNANLSMAELMAKMAAITLEKLQAARFATLKKKSQAPLVEAETVSQQKPENATNAGPPGYHPMASTSDAPSESNSPTKRKMLVQSKGSVHTKATFTSFAETECKYQIHGDIPLRKSRYIPLAVRRAVFQRDGYRCCYIDPITGRRCRSTFALQLDHKVAWAKGGLSTLQNLETKCAIHNSWAAIQEFGLQKMQIFRVRQSL